VSRGSKTVGRETRAGDSDGVGDDIVIGTMNAGRT